MDYIKAFLVGGAICAVGQILIDKTKMTPARILVTFVCVGAFLTMIGVYEKLVSFAGAGATVPITGFGYSLCRGVIEAIAEKGYLGILSGGLTAVSGGVAAAILFGFIASLLFRPKMK